jgi:hypothetical protein
VRQIEEILTGVSMDSSARAAIEAVPQSQDQDE